MNLIGDEQIGTIMAETPRPTYGVSVGSRTCGSLVAAEQGSEQICSFARSLATEPWLAHERLTTMVPSITFVAWLAASVGTPSTKAIPVTSVEDAERACDREAGRLSSAARRVTDGIVAPEKVKHVSPVFQQSNAKIVSAGPLVTEVLIGPHGDVEQMWIVRPRTPRRWPRHVEKAVTAAIGQWQYAPTVVDGKAVSLCMTVATTIDLR